jgi:flagellin
MSIDSVTLTSGMRSNLVSLQNTAQLLQTTQERLSTGKKVNSALDDPTAFFASQSLTSSANSLSSLQNSMGQAVQTIQAANNGITGITTLIEAAKGIAESASSTSNTTTALTYGQQYDSILTQIDTLAKDSGYSGTNLLGGNNLTVSFNADGTSTLTLTGSTVTSAGNLALTTASTGASAWSSSGAATVSTANITAALTALSAAETTLNGISSGLSGSLAVINARQTFTTAMINTLQTGSDNLTLADMNEEGANMLMLQTRQSLGTTALSLSSQAAQSVLKLFP